MQTSNHILLVEDDIKDIELTKSILDKYKFINTVIVRDGEEALDYLFYCGQYAEREKIKPFLIILDLKMPKLDGMQVLKEIRSNKFTRLIPVVVMSSSRENKDLETCYQLGANAYVVKSMQFTVFSENIRNIVEFWIKTNESLPSYLE